MHLDTANPPRLPADVKTEAEILAALDALPIRRRARLLGQLTRRLEDLRDLKAVKDAQEKGVYRDYSLVRRGLMARRAVH
jgi:hypothetical protein